MYIMTKWILLDLQDCFDFWKSMLFNLLADKSYTAILKDVEKEC